MNTYCLIISLLFALTVQQAVLLSSNLNNTMIVDPPNTEIGFSSHYNSGFPNYVGSGAQWLWKKGQSSVAANVIYKFESVFFVSCSEQATLSISADDIFQAQVNDGPIYSGQSWRNIYNFTLTNLKCGKNSVKLTITNTQGNSPAAVVFAITQDQSNCFQCQSQYGYYNRGTCRCECYPKTTECSNNPDFVWQAYPSCAFKCAEVKTCPNNQYFNPGTCTCKCNPVSCLPRWVFDQNKCQCQDLSVKSSQTGASEEI